MLQIIFAGVVQDLYPATVQGVWDDASGTPNVKRRRDRHLRKSALMLLRQAPTKAVIQANGISSFSFAFVGKRNAEGQFLYRERFYDLSPDFMLSIKKIVYLSVRLADELF